MYKRGGVWYISVGGIRHSARTTDRERAKALEHKLNAEAWDRRNGLIVPTWDQACLSWLDDNPGLAGKYMNLKHSKWWKEHLTGKRLDAITPKFIHGLISQFFNVSLTEPIGPNSTANAYVGFVGRVIRHASNLNPKFTYYPKTRGRDRWLTVDEWRTLSGAMNPDLRELSLFALVTGLREANVMGLQWSWVRGDWLEIPAELTKTRKPYAIPLNRTAQGVIESRRQNPVRHVQWVFTNAGRPWNRVVLCRAIKGVVMTAGIPEFTFHGFRHTFASWLAQKGVSHAIRARLGCWSTGSMADHYSHFDLGSLRPYAELLDGILAVNESQSSAVMPKSA